MKPHPAIAQLPTAMKELALELEGLDLPEEVRATCDDCAVAAPEGEQSHDRPFHIDARCCTYHPNHPNFLVGRALARGGRSREVVLARLADPEGVSTGGIAGTGRWKRPHAGRWFGRDLSLMCPYWVGGTRACGVWEDRGAVCRTWYCKYRDGRRGYHTWQCTSRLLRTLELRLAWFCLKAGQPPSETTVEALVPWFEWCAERVEDMGVVEVAELCDERLSRRIEEVQDALAALDPPVPEVVGPTVGKVEREGDRVWLVGFSTLDGIWLPRSIFAFLSRLDGSTPWREALDSANADLDEPLEPGVVERLWRSDALGVPDPSEVKPGMNLTTFSIDGKSLIDGPQLLDVLPFSFSED